MQRSSLRRGSNPARTWHPAVAVHQVDDLTAAIGAVLRDDLVPRGHPKPKRIRTTGGTGTVTAAPWWFTNGPGVVHRLRGPASRVVDCIRSAELTDHRQAANFGKGRAA